MGGSDSKNLSDNADELEDKFDFMNKGSKKSYPWCGVLPSGKNESAFLKLVKSLGLYATKTKRQGDLQGTTYEIRKSNMFKTLFKIGFSIMFIVILVIYIKRKIS